MRNTKRLLSLLLVVALAFSLMPQIAFAAGNTYTGVEARMPSVGIDSAIQDVKLNVRATTDGTVEKFTTVGDIAVVMQWYYLYRNQKDVPAEYASQYTTFTYDADTGTTLYIVPVTKNTEKFKLQEYFCLATITGSFTTDCEVEPVDAYVCEQSQTQIQLAYEVMPLATAEKIQDIACSVDANGYVTAPALNDGYIYMYNMVTDTASAMENPAGKTVGTISVNLADFKELTNNRIDITAPYIQLIKVSKEDVKFGHTLAVYGYGRFVLPMDKPYITVDKLEFGKTPVVKEVGTSNAGKYPHSVASAEFNGWFEDAQGTVTATIETDAYAVFTIRTNATFRSDLKASDFLLKVGDSAYAGAEIIAAPNSTTRKISFMIPSDCFWMTIQMANEGGSTWIHTQVVDNWYTKQPNDTTLSFTPDPIFCSDPCLPVTVTMEPGYTLKAIYVNGEEFTETSSSLNPLKKYSVVIGESGQYQEYIEVHASSNTVVTVEFGVADKITIADMPNARYPDVENNTGDEYSWHTNAQYYVAETIRTALCADDAIYKSEPIAQAMFTLNTQPDGSGISASYFNNQFYWDTPECYNNGVSDNITLYPLFHCRMHYTTQTDTTEWIYKDREDPTCVADGHYAYRKCPNCDRYEMKTRQYMGELYWEHVDYTDTLLTGRYHRFEEFTYIGNNQHKSNCVGCGMEFIENCDISEGTCKCGGEPTYKVGDLNGDGRLNQKDVGYLQAHLSSPGMFHVNQPVDYNKDGRINQKDVGYLQAHLSSPGVFPL